MEGGIVESQLTQRYESRLLLKDITKVLLSFPDRQKVEGIIEDISSQGLRVSIPPSGAPMSIPQKDETIEIFFVTINIHVACRCIYSMDGQENSLLMGFYVFDPDDQAKLRKILDSID